MPNSPGWRFGWREAFGPGLQQELVRLGNRLANRRMFSASRDIMVRSIILQLAFTPFIIPGARYDDVTLAANQVLMLFLEVMAYALDGFSISAEGLIGQAVGARSLADTRAAGRICTQSGLGGAVGLAVIFALSGSGLIDLMTTSPEVREAAVDYLP